MPRHLSDTRLYDLAMGAPLILFSGFALAGFAMVMPGQLQAQPPDYRLIITETVTGLFLALQLILVCMRRLPLRKAPGFWPRAWGFAGANLGYAVLLLPKTNLGPVMAGISATIVVTGTLGSLVTLFWLGRAFAILPQARMLVTTGPYAYLRHPLYLFEQWATLGVALQYLQPWGLLLVAASIAIQFPRMRYEEDVLRATFPGYEAYARSTPRLVPFLRPGSY
ncbi:MAG TPA: isoprenylcysteine carboxylmethyltransferase family protein [Rhizomicrobium sp.]|nr:isoprenylcysteine carboxylmethyltransferase family protein [Rhizomicrobium sp.]